MHELSELAEKMEDQQNAEDLIRKLERANKNYQQSLRKYRSLENQIFVTIYTYKIALFAGVSGLALFLVTTWYKLQAQIVGTEYYRFTWLAKIFNSIGFLIAVLAIGMFLNVWKKNENQFWYGIIEILAASSYCYIYLDDQGSLPIVNWLTAFYFAGRGFQNIDDGIRKPFKHKFRVVRHLIQPYIQYQANKRIIKSKKT